MLHSDHPITREQDDLLGRRQFAKQLAKSIHAFRPEDNLVVALYGNWGSGKTSVINLFKRSLNRHELEVMEFNPWLFATDNDMTHRFLGALSGYLASSSFDSAQGRTIADLLDKYRSLLSPLGESREYAIGGLRERLHDAFRQLDKRIVIIVDDLDRLSPAQIRNFFRLIKLCADFPRVTYLLAFDDDVVSHALTVEGTLDGKEYLEKIVQVEVHLPTPEGHTVHELFSLLLEDILAAYEVELTNEDRCRLGQLYSQHLAKILTNLRRMKRYLNSLAFHVSILKGEVNIVDFALLEVLRIFCPASYQKVQENRYLFSSEPSALDDFTSENSPFNRFIATLPQNEVKEVSGILAELYQLPALTSSELANYQDLIDSSRRAKRFSSKDYIDKYFILGVPHGSYSDMALDAFFSRLPGVSEDELENTFDALFSSTLKSDTTRSLLRKLDDRISTLEEIEGKYYKEDSQDKILPALVKVIFSYGDKLSAGHDGSQGAIDASSLASLLVRRLLRAIRSLDQRVKVLTDCFTKTGCPLFAMSLFPLRSTYAPEEMQPLPAEQEEEIKAGFIERLNKEYGKVATLLKKYKPAKMVALLHQWEHLAGANAFKSPFSRMLRSPKFCLAMVEGHAQRTDDGALVKIDIARLQKLVDPQRLLKMLLKMPVKDGRGRNETLVGRYMMSMRQFEVTEKGRQKRERFRTILGIPESPRKKGDKTPIYIDEELDFQIIPGLDDDE